MRNTLMFIIVLLINSCGPTDPGEPPEIIPPGYQEDIYWPSLADSPWPMDYGNPMNTGRSYSSGARLGVVDTVLMISSTNVNAAVGENGNLYFYTINGLIVFDSLYNLLWEFELPHYDGYAFPVVNSSNEVYIIAGNIYKFDSVGELIWEYNPGNLSYQYMILDREGNLIATSGFNNVLCLDKNGNYKWETELSNVELITRISISPDSKYLYISGANPSLIAFNLETMSVAWSFGTSDNWFQNSLVDSKGNVYVLTEDIERAYGPGLYSLSSEGNLRWYYELQDHISSRYNSYSNLAMNSIGDLIFGYDTLYSINFNGELNWKKYFIDSKIRYISIDDESSVFINSDSRSVHNEFPILKIDISGSLIWNCPVSIKSGSFSTNTPPSIGFNKIFFTSDDDLHSEIYVIK